MPRRKQNDPVRFSLETLDMDLTTSIRCIEKDDLEVPSKEKLVALRLMGKSLHRAGQLGVLPGVGTFIFNRGRWCLVGRGKNGKHILMRGNRNGK